MNSLQGNNTLTQEGPLGEPTLGTRAPQVNTYNLIRRLTSFGFHTVSSFIKRPDRVSRYSSGFWMFACAWIPAVHCYRVGQWRMSGPGGSPALAALHGSQEGNRAAVALAGTCSWCSNAAPSLICREPPPSPSRRKSALVLPFSSKSVCSMWRRRGCRARKLAGNEMNTHHGWRVS